MRPMRPYKSIRVQKLRIPSPHGGIPALLLSPVDAPSNATGVLWLHGGGYAVGMKEMVYASRAADLVRDFGAVVLSPGYRLSPLAPYPAALDDCYAALRYLKQHAASFGVRSDQLMVGGESAGGGLCAAVCIRARDEGAVSVAFQMPRACRRSRACGNICSTCSGSSRGSTTSSWTGATSGRSFCRAQT